MIKIKNLKRKYLGVLLMLTIGLGYIINAQNIEIINEYCEDGYFYIAINEGNNVDTIQRFYFECIYVSKRISKNKIELILEDPYQFSYFRIDKDSIWAYDKLKSGRIAGNLKLLSMPFPNYKSLQPKRETFIIKENGTIEFEMLDSSKTIVQIKDVEDRNLEHRKKVLEALSKNKSKNLSTEEN